MRAIGFFILVLLNGCANLNTTLENPTTHDRKYCRSWGWGIGGALIAVLSHKECVDKLKKEGYVEKDNK